SYTYLAIGVEPTNDTDLMSSCSNSASTAGYPPWTPVKTPSGSPASIQSSASQLTAEGSFSEGLITTVFPAAIAIGKNHMGTIAGKLNGEIMATGPNGWRLECTSTFVEAFSVAALEQVGHVARKLHDL